MVTDGNLNYCDHLTVHTNIESLYSTCETNVMSIIPQFKKECNDRCGINAIGPNWLILGYC